jgi:aspartyl-tRNA synthetase
MLRSHTCGELRSVDINKTVSLCGWVQRVRDKGGMIWIDLRDRYGITQLMFEEGKANDGLTAKVRGLGREFVIQVSGVVVERQSKNDKLTTGEIEIVVEQLTVLNAAKLPPFLIEDETDGGDELRMKYRYLDLRRGPVRENLLLRHKVAQQTRIYMDAQQFIEVETPVLIKSTPEGARDFVVPSRMNPGEFYALPQSPQTFKQLLMVSGFDRYYQIVKCFRDEDLRADRQPEFTQIDCEMSFVEQEDILNMFEGLIKFLFEKVKNIQLGQIPRMTYAEAMQRYGSDKPDIRFDMHFEEINDLVKNKGFQIFDDAELVLGIKAEGCADYTRKQIDELTDWIKRPQIGAKGLVYIKFNTDGSVKSSVDKFYSETDLKQIGERFNAQPGDMIWILSGQKDKVRKQLSELRLEMGTRLGLRNPQEYKVLWVIDFPLLEFGEAENRWFAMHHPFTAPKPEDIPLLATDLGAVRANAYDLVINGTEVGGGSVRIFQKPLQQEMFAVLGFTEEEAKKQFGFLMEAFEFGAPPHAGIAFGFDRLCSLFGGADSIRDFIAFPKNNSGRDVMIDSPSVIADAQLKELSIAVEKKQG